MPLSAKLKMQKEIDARNEAREKEFIERMEKAMTNENITIVLNALADKIRMLEWDKKILQERNEALMKMIPADKLDEITPF